MEIMTGEINSDIPTLGLVSGITTRFQQLIVKPVYNESRSFHNANAILVPHDAYDFVNNKEYIKYLAGLSKHKMLIIFDTGDFPQKIKIQNSVALRVAINPGESMKNKVVIPYNVMSLNFLPLRKYDLKPNACFVGHLPNIFAPRRLLKNLKQNPFNPIIGNGSLVRKIAVTNCLARVDDFVLIKRNSPNTAVKNQQLRIVERDEYINTISEMDIGLAPRGDANQSLRFYELLSAGRIPMIPNSKMIYPKILYGNEIQNLFISFNLFNDTSKVIETYWQKIGNNKNYEKIQNQIRALFDNHLQYNIFMKKLFELNYIDFLKLSNFTQGKNE
jgi:hypothetical protein